MVSISHAVYLVPDTDAAESFLSDVLGFVVTLDDTAINGDRFLTMAGPDSRGNAFQLQVVESPLQPKIAALKSEVGAVEFILDVPDAHSLINVARQAGLKIHREPTKAPYGVTAIFEDPFGYRWDVVQR
ncbi:MAG: catechol 2,3-dioxygenase-like lactoylglutathione lyase family enzyme [Candidatus Azotimanducaceae bacterium]|jgi:catechol 2,3-dioxygenase-like lactoylglutathione lyase family enzyme